MITIDHDNCSGCGLCVKECAFELLEIKDNQALISRDGCISCGHCSAVCPESVITVNKYDMSEVLSYNPQVMQIDADQLCGFMKYRRSVRQFTNIPVEKEKIDKIIEAGRYSPTGGNGQTVRYIVLQNQLEDVRKLAVRSLHKAALELPAEQVPYRDMYLRIYEAEKQNRDLLFYHAPALIAVLDFQTNNNVNASIAASRMELMANALGLGVCFIGFFVSAVKFEPQLNDLLGINSRYKIAASLAIGYPAVDYLRTVSRKRAKVDWK